MKLNPNDVCIPNFAVNQFKGKHGPMDFKVVELEGQRYKIQNMLTNEISYMPKDSAEGLFVAIYNADESKN